MKQQRKKIHEHAVVQALIKHADKRSYGGLQTSLPNTYTWVTTALLIQLKRGWQYLKSQLVNQNWILLGSELTVHVFNIVNLLNIVQGHEAGETLVADSNEDRNHMRYAFGKVSIWFNPHSLMNILLLALIME